MAQIQRADPAQLRRTVVIITVATLALLGIFFAARHWLLSAAQDMDAVQFVAAFKRMLGACVIAMALCLLLLGRHLLLRGRRIVRDRRYPANDARPLCNTSVREGDEAVRIGNASRLGGLIACLCGAAVALAGWFWVASLG
ncbi:MAG TPA: hypothetical protein VIC31_11245 [Rudaea sp.]|jgi:hypothetical protein